LIKKLIGYALIALVAFAIGTQTTDSLKNLLSKLKPQATTPAATAKQASPKADYPEYAKKTENYEEFAASAPDYTETDKVGKFTTEQVFYSTYLEAELIVPPGVFFPGEAEAKVFPLLSKNPGLFAGKTVLEIGAGSGPISIYAAKNGAVKVVSTDISLEAIAAITANADRLGVGDIVQARLVPLDDMSAYSAIMADEKFDIIISNPPYALDLDAPTNTAATDNGELGFSIVRGFKDHLQADGIAILYYDSLFYHQVMMKFARYEGFQVNNHNPIGLYTWEAEALFNSYLKRLLAKEQMDPKSFRFVRDRDGLNWKFLRNQGLNPEWLTYTPIMPGSEDMTYYPGWIAIQHSSEQAEADSTDTDAEIDVIEVDIEIAEPETLPAPAGQ
jgi:methylase of polypeptide subunit release factors